MNQALLHTYHRMPGWARPAAAALYGWVLRQRRYGRETEYLVEEALERETWSADRWRRWREERLAFVLRRAATQVPYYRNYWEAAGGETAWLLWRDLANWPVLEKRTLRLHAREFLAEDSRRRRLHVKQTSGTTGTPVPVWFSRRADRQLYALMEARCRRWYGVSRRDRWAILGGRLVAPLASRRPPFWVWNAPLNQLYLSTFHLSEELAASYLDAMARYKVEHLLGYTSSLAQLARAVLRTGRRFPLRVAVTNGEPLDGARRSLIAGAFECPVRETYGMVESAAAASECDHGRLHLWPEAGLVETGPLDRQGSLERLICTGLLNMDMPLVRYAVGDLGRLLPEDFRCPCGRTLPVLDRVDGRTSDLLMTRDGRLVFWLNPAFYGLSLEEAQIVQQSRRRITVRFVPGPGFGRGSRELLIQRLRERLGDVAVELEAVPEIPRGGNGKFQPVIRRMPAA